MFRRIEENWHRKNAFSREERGVKATQKSPKEKKSNIHRAGTVSHTHPTQFLKNTRGEPVAVTSLLALIITQLI